MDPLLQWKGAIRLRVQTADKNSTIIHKYSNHLTSVYELTFCEVKSCVFVINKSIITEF